MIMETSFSLSYSNRDSDTRDTEMDVTISFENADADALVKKLNVWLTAIGYDEVKCSRV